ncbi:MAG: hypothetical protein JW706_05240, partial [Opitutales bacterium]|nr:hypothetical protein [Opitutales bacterium]
MVRFKSPSIFEGCVLGLLPSQRVHAKVFDFRFLKMDEAMTLEGNVLTQGTGNVEPLILLMGSSSSILLHRKMSGFRRFVLNAFTMLANLDVF